ncbi:hypothetical protein ACJX0J_005916 [Zea mays]
MRANFQLGIMGLSWVEKGKKHAPQNIYLNHFMFWVCFFFFFYIVVFIHLELHIDIALYELISISTNLMPNTIQLKHKEVLHTEVEHMKEGRMETVDIDTNDRDKGMRTGGGGGGGYQHVETVTTA